MTVLRLGDGSLWVHSPIAPTDALVAELNALGRVRAVVAPNRSHHLHFLPFLHAFPGARGYVAPGLADKRPDLAHIEIASPDGWRPDLEGIFVEGLPAIAEIAWHHPVTRTLILTDLLFCFGTDNPPFARLLARVLGVDGRLAMSRTLRLLVRDRAALAATARRLLGLAVGRVVVAHDSVVDVAARKQLARAFEWLTLRP
jgi:hypothetical protein